jgi:hypothetical protein
VGSLKLEDPPETPIQLPNGLFIKACGSLSTRCNFDENGETFEVKFVVLPACLHGVILSDSFLQARSIELSLDCRTRIQYKPLNSTLLMQVCLNGNPRQQVVGSINGQEVMASPDIGSDANVITEARALALGLAIVADASDTELVLVDESIMKTCGIIYDVRWQFGKSSTTAQRVEDGKGSYVSPASVSDWKFGADTIHGETFMCDFYVVKELTVDVILSSTLLYGTNAFTACPEHFEQQDELKYNAASNVDHSNVAVLGLKFLDRNKSELKPTRRHKMSTPSTASDSASYRHS